MRRAALVFLVACTPTSTSAPARETSPPSSSASSAAASDASPGMPAPPASIAVSPLDALGSPSRALLQRLAREADAVPKGELRLRPPPDAERDAMIRARFGSQCRLERTCGPLWGIDCDAAVDGPYEYVRIHPDRLEVITTCGGACMGGRCTNCPPKKEGWSCATY